MKPVLIDTKAFLSASAQHLGVGRAPQGPLTPEQIDALKREAWALKKSLKGQDGAPTYNQILNQLAVRQGYADWGRLVNNWNRKEK